MTKAKPKTTYTKGSLYQIPCDRLKTDRNQPRKYFDPETLKALVNSIKDKGVIQPILFRQDQEGILFIVAGERRLRAAKEVGLETIPAIFIEGNPDEIALVENLLREDLNTIEFAEACDRLMKERGYNQEQLAGIIGKAKSTVSEILSLNDLPEEVRDECRTDPTISRKALIRIAKKKKPESMSIAFSKYMEGKLSPKTRGPKKGKRKTWQDKFTSKYDDLTTFVAEIDLGTLDTIARGDLILRIEELKRTADSLIETIHAAPAAPVKEKKAAVKIVKKKVAAKITKPAIRPVPKKAATKKKAVVAGKTKAKKLSDVV